VNAVIFGKQIVAKRKDTWYGDSDFPYTYSYTRKQELTWTKELSDLKQIVDELTETKFNSCLLNLYHNGNEGIEWYSDDEKSLGKKNTIASIDFWSRTKIFI